MGAAVKESPQADGSQVLSGSENRCIGSKRGNRGSGRGSISPVRRARTRRWTNGPGQGLRGIAPLQQGDRKGRPYILYGFRRALRCALFCLDRLYCARDELGAAASKRQRIVPVIPLELPDPTHVPDLEYLSQIPAVAHRHQRKGGWSVAPLQVDRQGQPYYTADQPAKAV
jgi:hypothetical protein